MQKFGTYMADIHAGDAGGDNQSVGKAQPIVTEPVTA